MRQVCVPQGWVSTTTEQPSKVCNAVISACRTQRWMRTITESENYNTLIFDTVAHSRAVDLILFKASMIGCFIKKKKEKKKQSVETVWTGLWKCELSSSARDMSNHIFNTPVPALFLARTAITQLEEPHSREKGALFYLWCSPNSNKTSPSHVKMLNVAARASWWQWSACLWRSTKADFDIWDDKETHTLRSSNRHFKIVVSAQTWCSGSNQHLWSRI